MPKYTGNDLSRALDRDLRQNNPKFDNVSSLIRERGGSVPRQIAGGLNADL